MQHLATLGLGFAAYIRVSVLHVVYLIFGHVGPTFPTLHIYKLTSLWYSKPISLKYLIATHMSVQIVR